MAFASMQRTGCSLGGSERRRAPNIFSKNVARTAFFMKRMTENRMGLFDGLIGGMVGAEMVTVVNGLIEKHGGVQGVVSQLQSGGLGPTVRSWIAEGANEPVSASEVHKAFGDQT